MYRALLLKIYLWMILIGISSVTFGQELVITGHVSDESNQPMPGVTVIEKGTSNGVSTNINGDYSITINTPEPILSFSFMGYLSEDISVGDKRVLDIQLTPSIEKLDEVVVVGYGTMKKSDITTSMVTINSDDLKKETQGNFTSALQGRASGVQVITNNGAPGGTPKVLVRGFTTINCSTDPLYVVDGIPIVKVKIEDGIPKTVNGDINFISSDEIENIEVLKDASAAAIYGTRASAGVILVTTKRGKAGKTKYDFSLTYGSQASEKPYEVMNSQQYAQAMNLSEQNSGFSNLIEDTENLNYTDWWAAGIRNYSPQLNASLNMSGGTENYRFNLMMTYYEQKSMYNVGKWQRFTARINNDLKLADWLNIGIDMNPRREYWENTPDWYGDYLLIDPVTPIMRPTDQLTGDENEYSKYMRSLYTYTWNPVAKESRQKGNGGDNYALYSNAYINLTPIKNLVIRSQAGVNVIATTEKEYKPEFVIDPSHEFNATTSISRKKITDFNYTWQNTATYSINVEKHSGSIMVGTTAEKQNYEFVYGYREGYTNTSEELLQLDGSTGTVYKATGNIAQSSIVSYISRLTYNYDNRYLLTATGRRDGSSKFMDKNKWAFFPSASAAWRFSNEEFLKDNTIVSDGKLFAGWGTVGNQYLPNGVYASKIGNDGKYVFGDGTVMSTTYPSTLKNEDIRWETVEEKNIGIDVKLFSSLSATVEYYQKVTHDMLFKKNYPYYSSIPDWGSIWTNIGEMEAKGVDVALGYNYVKDKLSFDINATLSHAKIEVKELAGVEQILGGDLWSSDQPTRMVEGDEPGYFYGYKTDGIFQNEFEVNSHTSEHGDILQEFARPGDIRFVDVNNDGVLNADDRVKIGSPYPDFTGGIMMNAAYKTNFGEFDLGVNLYFSYGNDVVNYLKYDKYSATGHNNLADDALSQAWHGEGTSTDVPILSHNDLNENFTKFSDYYIEDGSYLRLKSLQIGYTLPQSIISSLKISNARIYVSGQNLATWTKFTGTDPETKFEIMKYGFSRFSYPMLKTFLLGFNISF